MALPRPSWSRLVLAAVLLCAAGAHALPYAVFGPKSYTRSTAAPQPVRSTFAARAASYKLSVQLGAVPVTSATVTLNGATVLGPKDFTGKTPPSFDRDITLQASNELVVDVAGNPGASLTLRINGDDSDLPTITASITPPPNASGWIATLPVRVTFTCADATSGIATCSDPVLFEGKGAGLTVEGVATDIAGNRATTQLKLNIDDEPPAIRVIAPPELAAGTNAPSVKLRGFAGDNDRVIRLTMNGTLLSTTAGGDFTADIALHDGANPIVFEAYDRAGNRGTSSLTIERFAIPTVTITSPADLAVLQTSTATVSGTVSEPGARVVVNGVEAVVSAGTFTASGVALQQGRTVLTAVATTPLGRTGTANINVYRDGVPPRVDVRYPAANATLYTNATDVLGMVDDVVVGTINSGQARVTVNGVVAEVANRAFVAHGVPLVPGANVLRVVATDQGGNSATTPVTVTYDATARPKIVVGSGNGQSAPIGTELPQPIAVRLLNADGSPAANKPVSFSIAENDGTLLSGTSRRTSIVTTTNASGIATARWTLGMRAGAGNNRVVARAEGFSGSVELEASGRTGPAALLVVDSGNNQFGAVGAKLARPLVAVAIDSGNNRLANVRVVFSLLAGSGNFDGAETTIATTDSDGRAYVTPMLTATGTTEFAASIEGSDSQIAFTAIGKTAGPADATAIAGVILDNTDLPIAGVTVRVEGTTLTTTSDEQGQFTIGGAPVGYVKLLIDGSTSRRAGTWPTLEYVLYTIPGANNTLEMPIHILPLDVRHGLFVDETTGGTLTLPDLPGFSLTVAPGSATFPGGSRTGTVSVTLVHADKIPMAPGFGQQPNFIVTVQPPGVHFDPPAALTFPNVDGLAPNEITELYSFDHDLGQFVSIGTGSVSSDGSIVKSDPGVGIVKGGWHCGGDPKKSGTVHKCPDCKKCIDDCCKPDAAQNGFPCGTMGAGICKNGDCICPHPTNFHETSASAAGGVIKLTFAWDSSTGSIVDLANCTTGELLDNSDGAYTYPSPPFATTGIYPMTQNVSAGSAVDGQAQDTFLIQGGGFKKPYAPYYGRSIQRYYYQCPCINGGSPVVMAGPFAITRRIYDDGAGNWYYQVARNGQVSVTKLP